MSIYFHHEKLVVYQKAIAFVARAEDVLVARRRARKAEIQDGKALLAETVSLLLGLQRRVTKAAPADYGAGG